MGAHPRIEAQPVPPAVEAFIARWQGREGGQERANYGMFLTEFCATLALPPPDPAGADRETNDYVFERVVSEPQRDGATKLRRIDLYKRDGFVLEAKQSRQTEGGDKQVHGPRDLFGVETPTRGRRGAERGWDILMFNARQQAEDYVRLLPQTHEPPPFVVVCDVGHCFELYANFRRDGKAYDQFPDRSSFRIYLEDLRKPEVRERLTAVWTEPLALDPAKKSAEVTRAIAVRLAKVSKALEEHGEPAEDVAMFLMRCLFTMFSENVGLLPENSFRDVLARCEQNPDAFPHAVGQLWEAMDAGGWAHALQQKVRKFNGEFFRNKAALRLPKEEIGELRHAASYDWRNVDPSIFGALLEQALDPQERRRLGAHYTPRAYVERLVAATIIEPLRAEWGQVVGTVERQKAEGREPDALACVRKFHDKLCVTRVLDPACGTGNFLYVSLEMMKRLEGEVLEALADLGGQEALTGLEGHGVDPHQFLGMEINPRAAAIAELVLWIGHLQWHIRTKGGLPSEPILKAFRNIVVRDAVLAADKALKRDENGRPMTRPGPDGLPVEIYDYKSPRRAEWPEAEFIIGNPPFIGKGELMRAALGQTYLDALRVAYPKMNESADYVMYWWDHAATVLASHSTSLQRFAFVTTNSITQIFNRRVVERHVSGPRAISIILAVSDHPWTKATPNSAAVRIAMTVAALQAPTGRLLCVLRERGLDTDSPLIDFTEKTGRINADLTVGVDLTSAHKLTANQGVSSNGVLLAGRGFVLSKSERDFLTNRLEVVDEDLVRPYINGRDMLYGWSNNYLIDCSGYSKEELRCYFPSLLSTSHSYS